MSQEASGRFSSFPRVRETSGPARCPDTRFPLARERRRCDARALTLVEILAVLVILALLAGTLVVGFSGSMSKARRELAKTGISTVVSKLELYQIEFGVFPTLDEGLTMLTDGRAAPTAPYYLTHDQTRDPWGHSYVYVAPGPEGHPYEVLCYGADGQPGGAPGSYDADISSINLGGQGPGPGAGAGAK